VRVLAMVCLHHRAIPTDSALSLKRYALAIAAQSARGRRLRRQLSAAPRPRDRRRLPVSLLRPLRAISGGGSKRNLHHSRVFGDLFPLLERKSDARVI
jgi:hypothetical protein